MGLVDSDWSDLGLVPILEPITVARGMEGAIVWLGSHTLPREPEMEPVSLELHAIKEKRYIPLMKTRVHYGKQGEERLGGPTGEDSAVSRQELTVPWARAAAVKV